MNPEQLARVVGAVLAAIVALLTVALTLAQWLYWNDSGAAFATFMGGGFVAAFLKPE